MKLQDDYNKHRLMSHKSNLFLIVLAGVLVYANSLNNSFVWDDILIIINNDFIKGLRLIPEMFLKPLYYFTNSDFLYYRPFQNLSSLFDYYIYGLSPLGFHLTNLLLHICAAVMVYCFINILSFDRELSFFVSLFFVVHPINTSVVNYVSSRADILLTIFAMFSLILFLKANNYKIYLLSFACFVLALLSKETAIVLPLSLVFIKEMHLKMSCKKDNPGVSTARFWYLSFLIMAVLYIFLRTQIIGLKFSILPASKIDTPAAIFTSVKIITNYLRLIFLPFGLHMLRAVDIAKIGPLNTAFCLAIIMVSVLVMINLYRKGKILFIALGLFFIWFLPVFSVAFRNPEYYSQQKAIMEEHWLYIPAIGIFIMIYVIAKKCIGYLGNKLFKVILVLAAVYFSIISVNENTHWKNNYTLFVHASKYVNYSSTLYRNLGWVYINRNEKDKALEMYTKALNLKQGNKQKMVLSKDIAYAYFLNGRFDQTIDFCRKAISIDPDYSDGHAYLGLGYSKSDLSLAINEWKIALDKDRYNSMAFNNLLNLSISNKTLSDYLIKKYESLLNQDKDFERYRIYLALGKVYLYSGRYSEALFYLEKAGRINPYDAGINNAMAVLYAKLKNYDKAVELFKVSLKLNPFYKETYNNFSLLYKELNMIDESKRLLERAVSVNMYN